MVTAGLGSRLDTLREKDILPSTDDLLSQLTSFVVPIIAIIVLWWGGAAYLANPRLLPEPVYVFELLWEYIIEGDPRGRSALSHLQVTLVRVIIGSFIALGLGITIGVLTATKDVFERGIIPIMPFWMTAPTVVVILITMVLFNFSDLSIYSAVIIAATPFAAINIWEGARDIDADLLEMAYTFEATTKQVWTAIYIPHLMSYIFGTYRYILGMVWKIVVLAEVFGIDSGIGAMIRFYYNQGDVASIFAYLILFIVVMFVIEYLILDPLEQYIFRWRDH